MAKPAGWWRDALPVGNGAIGAMPYGRVRNERVLLNHEKLWYRGCTSHLPDISSALSELRSLMAQQHYVEANDLYHNTLTENGFKGKCASYHPAGDLCIDMPVDKPFRNYSRHLDYRLPVPLWNGLMEKQDMCVIVLSRVLQISVLPVSNPRFPQKPRRKSGLNRMT